MENLLREFMLRRRSELKLSQVECAKRAGCEVRTWGRWERQSTLVRAGKWPAIAKALDVQVDDLFLEVLLALQKMLGLKAAGVAALQRLGQSEANYVFRYEPIAKVAAMLELELNKIDQLEWKFPIGRWRTMMRQQLIAIEDQLFAAESQAELFRDFVMILIGETSISKMERLRKRKLRITRKAQGEVAGRAGG